jgi:hypothetical protein
VLWGGGSGAAPAVAPLRVEAAAPLAPASLEAK